MKPWQHDQLRRALEQRRALLLDELRRDAGRVREVEAARKRLAEGAYGICVECQAHHEKTYRG